MRIIISPAKKMRVDTDGLAVRGLPAFLPQTETLCRTMQGMPAEALQKLWMCNDRIAALNVERLRHMDLYTQLTPALLSYEGIQYRYMAPNVFTGREYDYIQERLRILSGFYGVLRPFDGVRPYDDLSHLACKPDNLREVLVCLDDGCDAVAVDIHNGASNPVAYSTSKLQLLFNLFIRTQNIMKAKHFVPYIAYRLLLLSANAASLIQLISSSFFKILQQAGQRRAYSVLPLRIGRDGC